MLEIKLLCTLGCAGLYMHAMCVMVHTRARNPAMFEVRIRMKRSRRRPIKTESLPMKSLQPEHKRSGSFLQPIILPFSFLSFSYLTLSSYPSFTQFSSQFSVLSISCLLYCSLSFFLSFFLSLSFFSFSFQFLFSSPRFFSSFRHFAPIFFPPLTSPRNLLSLRKTLSLFDQNTLLILVRN